MIQHYSEDEIVSAVALLTSRQLVSFVEAEIVVPLQSDNGPVFSQMDVARVELVCDLCDQYDLDDEVLVVIMSLVDQLHGVRAELQTVLGAVEAEDSEVRRRIGEVLYQRRSNS